MDVNVEYARYPEVNPLPQLSYDTKTVNGSNVLVDAAKLVGFILVYSSLIN